MTTLTELYGVRNGLNVDNLDVTTEEEIDAFLNHARRARGPLDPGPQYEMRANAMWLHSRPDFAKLHMRVLDGWHSQGVDPIISASSFANLHTYINQGWLIGIENCTRGLQLRGVTNAQLLEGIMRWCSRGQPPPDTRSAQDPPKAGRPARRQHCRRRRSACRSAARSRVDHIRSGAPYPPRELLALCARQRRRSARLA